MYCCQVGKMFDWISGYKHWRIIYPIRIRIFRDQTGIQKQPEPNLWGHDIQMQ